MGWQIATMVQLVQVKVPGYACPKKINFTYLIQVLCIGYYVKSIKRKNRPSNETNIFFRKHNIIFQKKKILLDLSMLVMKSGQLKLLKMFLSYLLQNCKTKLVEMQRKFASDNNIVMDGRDIGTVVLPNANIKIYLDATVEERANRRRLERLKKSNLDISLEKTITEITERDYKDSNRKISPLKQADDAIRIDTTDLEINEVLQKVIELAIERGFNMENEKDLLEKEVTIKEEEKDSKSLNEEDTTPSEKSSVPTKLKNLQQVEGIVKEVTKAKQKSNGTLTEEKVIFVFENGQEGILSLSDTTLEANESLFDYFFEDEKYTVFVKRTLPNNKVLFQLNS